MIVFLVDRECPDKRGNGLFQYISKMYALQIIHKYYEINFTSFGLSRFALITLNNKMQKLIYNRLIIIK